MGPAFALPPLPPTVPTTPSCVWRTSHEKRKRDRRGRGLPTLLQQRVVYTALSDDYGMSQIRFPWPDPAEELNVPHAPPKGGGGIRPSLSTLQSFSIDLRAVNRYELTTLLCHVTRHHQRNEAKTTLTVNSRDNNKLPQTYL